MSLMMPILQARLTPLRKQLSKMATKLNLLVGGPQELWPESLLNNQVTGDWIGIDRGTLSLIKLGIDPLVAIGDFDSMSMEELDLVKNHVTDIRQSIPEKDDTDTQLGLVVALNEFNADYIDIYGATGGRIDHFLANLWLVLEPRFHKNASKIRMIDRQNTINFYLPGNYQITKEPDKKYLAFIPLTPVSGLTLRDEKYRLTNFNANRPMSFASNEFVGNTGHFSFDSGVVCVIQSKDWQ